MHPLVAAKTKARIGMAPRGAGGASPSSFDRTGGGAGGIRSRLSGKPIRTCNPAQIKQAVRHPYCASSSADNGQPTVLAKPAISVMPVIGPRAALP